MLYIPTTKPANGMNVDFREGTSREKETTYNKDDARNHSGTEEGDLTFKSAFQISFVVKAQQ